MGVKEMLGLGDNKGSNCTLDENGVKRCAIMIQKGNTLLATGSNYGYTIDNKCNVTLSPDSRILEQDEAEVEKQMRRDKKVCMGGGNIN